MIKRALCRIIGVYEVEGKFTLLGGDRPGCEGLGSVECRIIAERVNSVEINL